MCCVFFREILSYSGGSELKLSGGKKDSLSGGCGRPYCTGNWGDSCLAALNIYEKYYRTAAVLHLLSLRVVFESH
jgi:hypothetical protein